MTTIEQEQTKDTILGQIEPLFMNLIKKLDEILNHVSINISAEKNDEYRTLSSVELQMLLGISKKTLIKYRTEGLIKFRQIGSKIFYTRRDIEEFFEKSKKTNN